MRAKISVIRTQLLRAALLSVIFVVCTSFGHSAPQDKIAVPKEVMALVGVYTGQWTLYGIDKSGNVTKKMAWTDTLKAANPRVEAGRAFVTTSDEMTYENATIPPRKFQGSEGYLLHKDGTLGDYFLEAFGQTTPVQRLDNDTWVYSEKADPRELTSLGFTGVISGHHVLVKVITQEQGKEAHHITRITTVHWKEADGHERWTQFVSLEGTHHRSS